MAFVSKHEEQVDRSHGNHRPDPEWKNENGPSETTRCLAKLQLWRSLGLVCCIPAFLGDDWSYVAFLLAFAFPVT